MLKNIKHADSLYTIKEKNKMEILNYDKKHANTRYKSATEKPEKSTDTTERQ